jgi:hypothetical protein
MRAAFGAAVLLGVIIIQPAVFAAPVSERVFFSAATTPPTLMGGRARRKARHRAQRLSRDRATGSARPTFGRGPFPSGDSPPRL